MVTTNTITTYNRFATVGVFARQFMPTLMALSLILTKLRLEQCEYEPRHTVRRVTESIYDAVTSDIKPGTDGDGDGNPDMMDDTLESLVDPSIAVVDPDAIDEITPARISASTVNKC